MLLIPFFGFTELQRVLGKGTLQELFFHPRQISNQPTEIAKTELTMGPLHYSTTATDGRNQL